MRWISACEKTTESQLPLPGPTHISTDNNIKDTSSHIQVQNIILPKFCTFPSPRLINTRDKKATGGPASTVCVMDIAFQLFTAELFFVPDSSSAAGNQQKADVVGSRLPSLHPPLLHAPSDRLYPKYSDSLNSMDWHLIQRGVLPLCVMPGSACVLKSFCGRRYTDTSCALTLSWWFIPFLFQGL